MKLAFKSNRGLHFVSQEPDEELKKYWTDKVADTVRNEQIAFAQEVAVAMRNLKPGQKKTIKSRPIVVTIEREKTKPTGTPLE